MDMDCWLPHFCQLRDESRWSKFDEDDAGFYDGVDGGEVPGTVSVVVDWKGTVRGPYAEEENECDENVSISSLVSKMNLEEKNRTTAIAVRECGEKENQYVIPRILGGGNGQVSRRRVERGAAPVSADESDC